MREEPFGGSGFFDETRTGQRSECNQMSAETDGEQSDDWEGNQGKSGERNRRIEETGQTFFFKRYFFVKISQNHGPLRGTCILNFRNKEWDS